MSQIWYPDKEVDCEVLKYQAYNLYKGHLSNDIRIIFQRKSYLASLKLWNCKVLITIYPFFFLPKNKQLRLIAILQFWVLENNYAWVL